MYGSTELKLFLDRILPERQIYHRSSGEVRYVTLSGGTQLGLSMLAVVLSGWFAYASVSYVVNFSARGARSTESEVQLATYERWLRHARAKEAAAISLLEERTIAFSEASEGFERRHATLKSLLGSMREDILATVVDGPGSRTDGVLMRTSVEEADARSHRTRLALDDSEPAGDLQQRVSRLDVRQMALLDSMEAEAADRTERLQGLLRLTGVDVGEVLESSDLGGPYLEFETTNTLAGDDAFFARARQVAARLEQARQFERMIGFVPLGIPVDAPHRLTSPFGRRVDPFTGRMAWHSGVDLAAYKGSAIISAAPGTITFAGRKSGYGRVVEVDHGYGFKTRYGHLKSISVRKGQTVAIGDRLGIMGSTGRSTGVHLHYEVSFRGKIYDPKMFLKANRYVQKG